MTRRFCVTIKSGMNGKRATSIRSVLFMKVMKIYVVRIIFTRRMLRVVHDITVRLISIMCKYLIRHVNSLQKRPCPFY